jgi:hypothetical protein
VLSQEQVELDVFIGVLYGLEFSLVVRKLCTPSTVRIADCEITTVPR